VIHDRGTLDRSAERDILLLVRMYVARLLARSDGCPYRLAGDEVLEADTARDSLWTLVGRLPQACAGTFARSDNAPTPSTCK